MSRNKTNPSERLPSFIEADTIFRRQQQYRAGVSMSYALGAVGLGTAFLYGTNIHDHLVQHDQLKESTSSQIPVLEKPGEMTAISTVNLENRADHLRQAGEAVPGTVLGATVVVIAVVSTTHFLQKLKAIRQS